MRILKSLFLVCFLTIGVLAQQSATISGRLTKNGKVIANTQIRIVKPESQTQIGVATTDENGSFQIEGIADGNYFLVFTNSQNQEIKQVAFIKDGKITTDYSAESSINNSSILLGEVSIIASGGTLQTDGEISKTVDTIENREIRERNEFSLIDSLRTIPGFRVQQLGGFGRTANIKSRGLRNQDTAVLIDGVRFRDAASITGDASAFLSDFTFAAENRVEVLRGAGSSLYGTNAVGGTLDFQTPRPQSGFRGGFLAEGGGLGLKRVRGNVSDGTANGKFAFNLGVGRTVFSEGIDGEDDARNTNFQSRIEYNPFSKTNISARFFVSDAFVRLNSSPDTIGTPLASNQSIIDAVPLSRDLQQQYTGAPLANTGGANFVPDANDPDANQKSQFFNGQLVLTQILTDKLVFQGYYQGLRSRRTNDNGRLGVGFQSASTSIFDGTIQTANGHFNYTPNTGNLITFGYEFEDEKYGNDGFSPNPANGFTTRARQSSNTFYAQDQLDFFGRKLQVSGGVRAQFFNLKNPVSSGINPPYQNVVLETPPSAYTFDGSASYFFEKTGTKIRTHVGNGYRIPSLYERFGSFYSSFAGGRFIPLGDPNLKPERSIGFDAGIDQSMFNNRARLSAVYFYTRLTDTIGFARLAQPDLFGRDNNQSGGGYLNTKGGLSRGAEFSGRVRATDSTDVFASYTFINSDQRAPQVTGTTFLQTLGVPNHQFTIVATQRFGKRLSANFDFLATSDYLAPIFSGQNFRTYVFRFGGNRRADLTGRYELPVRDEKLRLVFAATVENLFDYDYFENGFRTTGRTARGSVGLNF